MPDRLPPDRVLVPELDRLPLERDELDFALGVLDFALEVLDFSVVEPAFALVDRERDEDARERDELRVDRDEPFEELRLLDLERRRELPPLRSAAGISSRATAFASCSICFARNFAMRSSSRRMPRASLTVSLSPTVSASVSIAE